jgi:hypothetical protein
MRSDRPRGVPNPKHSRSGRAAGRRSNASSTVGRSEIQLTALELALVAEFNVEMAAAYDEVADDTTAQPATREAAREAAARHRERAGLFQLEAERASASPAAVAEPPSPEQRPYVGPERRRAERRTSERRRLRSPAQEQIAQAERRMQHDRRQHDRRRSGP